MSNPSPKLVEPARERSERLCRNLPVVEKQTWSQPLGHAHLGFDTTGSLALAGRLNRLSFFRLVEPARERSERLCRNHPAAKSRPGHDTSATRSMVSAQPAGIPQAGSTGLGQMTTVPFDGDSKVTWVIPGCPLGAIRSR